MAKGNQGKGKAKAKAKARRAARQERRADRRNMRASRDVQMFNQPGIDALNAQMQQSIEDFQREMQYARSIYGGATDALQGLASPDFGGIADDLQERLSTLGGLYNGEGLPASEVAAAQGLGNAIGAGGFENLASFDARNQMAQQGASRESILSGRNAQDALLQHQEDVNQEYNNALRNLYAQFPTQISAREDELRDRSVENQLARSKMEGDRAFSQFLQGQLGGMTGGGGGGGGGGRTGGRNGGNQAGTFTGGYGGYGGGPDTWGGSPNPNPGGHPGPGGSPDPMPNHWRRETVQAVRQADSVGDLPGWVRYAYNRTGGTALHNQRRRKLYEQRLGDILRRKFGEGGSLYR